MPRRCTLLAALTSLFSAPALVDAYGSAGAPPRQARRATSSRAAVVSMGLFDGVKDAFGSGGDKPMVAADRVTPFDRWMGLDKALMDGDNAVDESATYVDPNDPTNYFLVSLPKPMGIAFVENDNNIGGVYVDAILPEGSAASEKTPLNQGDQLVGVDGTVVAGLDFDSALDAIRASDTPLTKLTFFRGPTVFLYGPSARARQAAASHQAPNPHRCPASPCASCLSPPSLARSLFAQPLLPKSGTRRRCSHGRLRPRPRRTREAERSALPQGQADPCVLGCLWPRGRASRTGLKDNFIIAGACSVRCPV